MDRTRIERWVAAAGRGGGRPHPGGISAQQRLHLAALLIALAALPPIVVTKAFSAGTMSASYARINNSGIGTWGGALDIPVIRGSLATPEIAVRGSYATVTGVNVYKLKTYGAEAFVSKGFGPLTPYGSIGRQRIDARGDLPAPLGTLHDKSEFNRLTLGLRISLLVPKLAVEATQGEVRSYAAKISVGF